MSREICLKEALRDPVIVWALWKWAFICFSVTPYPGGRWAEARIHRRHPPCSYPRTPGAPSHCEQSQTLSESFIWNNRRKQCIIVPAPLTHEISTDATVPCPTLTGDCVHHWYYNSRDRFSMSRSRGGEELMFSLMDQESLSHNQEDQQ